MASPIERLRYHVSGAIERGEKQAIAGIPAQEARPDPYGYYARKAARLFLAFVFPADMPGAPVREA